MGKTSIEWADAVWNPVTGCTKVSQGCKHCYAETMATRFWKDRKFTDVQMHMDRLEEPLNWRKPRRVFVNSMSDLFHNDVSLSFIARVISVMRMAEMHTFMVLTKRPERMIEAINTICKFNPLPDNVWLGVSVENQETADQRIPLLLQTSASKRFVSCEPLLGPVRFEFEVEPEIGLDALNGWRFSQEYMAVISAANCIDWVICGGESGRGARAMHPEWARGLRDQCQAADVPFFFKQWGQYRPVQFFEGWENHKDFMRIDQDGRDVTATPGLWNESDALMERTISKKDSGRLLDGQEWNEFPGGNNV